MRRIDVSSLLLGHSNMSVGSQLTQPAEALNYPPPFELLLTPNQMIDNGYNLPSYIQAGDRIIIPGRPTPVNGTGNGAVAGPSKLPSEDRVDPRPLKDGWVETPEAQGPPADGRWPVLSMDCEMVCLSPYHRLILTGTRQRLTGRS